jgi:prephenate dehydrogenase
VLDVCSVKEYPVRVMKRFLPKSVEILATHPNFGPDSAADTLAGRQITLCPVRISSRRLGEVLRALQKKKLKVVRLSPGDHDRRMAASLLLTHFIGRSLIDFGAKTTGMDTEGYQRLLRILQTVQNDSWQLFEDMNHYNRHAARMRARLIKSISRVDARVNR